MSPAAVVVPASHLRAHHVLCDYDNAVVTRPPLLTADGSLSTVVVTTGATRAGVSNLRLLRLPVDQPVRVTVDAPDQMTSFVRSSRVTRSAGTTVQVLDLSHPDSDIVQVGRSGFAVLCTSHHTIGFHASVATAEARASHPEEWCAECRDLTRQRAHARVHGTTTVARSA